MGARLLDLTRSLRRVGGMATGIDRVERAYLARFVADDCPCFGLLRTPFGYLLLDRAGLVRMLDGLEGRAAWDPADFLARLRPRRNQSLIKAESTLRKQAIARCLPQGLRRMLGRYLPTGFEYFNVGHSNLTDRVLEAVRQNGGAVKVLVHDVIPLDHPDWQRPGTVRPFADKMQRLSRRADRVIYPSRSSQIQAEARFAGWGRTPPAVVAPLGIDDVLPDARQLPPGLPPPGPYFVTVGTIEPRKNHGFLLDLWEEMGPDAPPLLICGSRGWDNAAVFARLDRLPEDGPVREVPGLSDAGLAALVSGASGLLAPSLAEGFGLPPMEALRNGTQVLANDIPVFRELLANHATILSIVEKEKWVKTLKQWGKNPSHTGNLSGFEAQSWDQHFRIALSKD